ncbi:hypothetical protein IEI94_19650 [Halomonas sp. ML-15]|uniref:hypothetical protein n=1 Tax=Halomonas sp. ML-15 TaxID=2773305 RepID=UPI001745E520|nr:hypothetical protein [Halomonas sp. ML-15]MBD3898072.1 hypothetical protein [Halomonas sp. ML-15]
MIDVPDDNNALFIYGDEGDSVELGSGWSASGSVTESGREFTVYHGNSEEEEFKIESAITVDQ